MRELLEKYPKAAKVVKEYYLDKLLKSLDDKNLPDEFKNHVRQQGLQGGVVEEVLENSPRNLWDVFDLNKVYIDIAPFYDKSNDIIEFSFWVHNDTLDFERELESEMYKTRIETEKEAIKIAFEVLESKLQ